MHPPAIYLAGPTAVGKTALSLKLAVELSAEIISVDSMQVYRGLDIGTAKPSQEERRQVPHHLIDVLDLNESCDAAKFLHLARQAEAEIRARGKIPLFCGGTGLYFQTLRHGVSAAPPADPALRAQLEATDLPALLAELQQTDPETYNRVDRQNKRRVVRALEVIRLAGKPLADLQPAWNRRQSSPGLWIGLNRERAELCARVNSRVDAMFAAGLVEEVRRLLDHGLSQNPTAMQAIGYRQVVEHLHGARSLEETIELVKQKTRQFAKRQMTWFKGQLNLTWLPAHDESAALAQIIASYKNLAQT